MDPSKLGIQPDTHPPVRVRMGRKSARGGVEDRDVFTLTKFRAVGVGRNAVSVEHPDFAAFNGAARDKRTVLRGNLVYGEFFADARLKNKGSVYSRFSAELLPNMRRGTVGHNRPACIGDGSEATRWDPRASEFKTVECPGDLCEFRQDAPDGTFPPCKRTSTLVFQLRWPKSSPMACSMAMIETAGSWSFATHQWWGFYEIIKGQWNEVVGVGAPNVYGLPVRLQLVETHTNGRKLWVPELHTDFEEGGTLQSFLRSRADATGVVRRLFASDGNPLALPNYGAVEAVDASYEDVPVERPAP